MTRPEAEAYLIGYSRLINPPTELETFPTEPRTMDMALRLEGRRAIGLQLVSYELPLKYD